MLFGQFSCISFQRLPTSIGNLTKLRVLDLEENKLDVLPHEIGKAEMACRTSYSFLLELDDCIGDISSYI